MPEFKTKEEYERWKVGRAKINTPLAPLDRGENKDEIPPQARNDKQEGGDKKDETLRQAQGDTKLMKKCPYCFTEMDQRASVCPSCKKQVGNIGKDGIARRSGSAGKALLFVFGMFFIIGLIGVTLSSKKEATLSNQISESIPDKYEACKLSRELTKLYLKAPSTAKFEKCEGFEKDGILYIVSSVDSQNSFSAMLRTQYAWHGSYNYDKKEWDTKYYALEGKIHINKYE